jgi:hypothetical protein
MTNRENVLRALRRDSPERVPFDFVLCPSHVENFKKKQAPAITLSILVSRSVTLSRSRPACVRTTAAITKVCLPTRSR